MLPAAVLLQPVLTRLPIPRLRPAFTNVHP